MMAPETTNARPDVDNSVLSDANGASRAPILPAEVEHSGSFKCALIIAFDERGKPIQTGEVDVPEIAFPFVAGKMLRIADELGLALEIAR